MSRTTRAAAALALLAGAMAITGASAQPPAAKPGALERFTGVWIEGPGYDIGYGGTYEACAVKCLAAERCRMIEYYRPEKKCNMYDAVRPRLKGGSSDVSIKR